MDLFQNWEVAIKALGALLASGLIGLGAHVLVFSLIKRLARRTPYRAEDAFIYADYTLPVQSLREELHSILSASNLWDGRVWGLQVTGATERAVELRALISASDASSAWDLRCDVREKLLTFIQKKYPESLPRLRAELASGQGEGGD
jgi:hypothetical protein